MERAVVMPRRREGLGGLAVGLLVAVLIHAVLLPLLPSLVRGMGVKARKHGTQLVHLSKEQFNKNKRIELKIAEAQPIDDPEKKKKKADDDDVIPPGQVVAMPPPDKEERPKFADHASEWDQTVARETRSRDQASNAPNVTRKLEQGKIGQQEETVGGTGAVAKEATGPQGPGRAETGDSGSDATDGKGERMFALEIPRQAARAPLNLKVDIDGIMKNRAAVPEIAGNGDTARIAMGNTPADKVHNSGSGGSGSDATGQGLIGGGNGTRGLPSLAELTPTERDLARLAGAPSNDYLPEIEVDAQTQLNAWRWKHATFFNRVADRIRRTWQGGTVLTHNDPAGSVYGFEDRMTVVQVTLDRDGNVLDVNIEEPSGAVVLDDEAVRAFKQAGPFANPPTQLFKGTDKFTFLFGFNVSYNRTNFDLNWRPN